jgi:hypothetical protein
MHLVVEHDGATRVKVVQNLLSASQFLVLAACRSVAASHADQASANCQQHAPRLVSDIV